MSWRSAVSRFALIIAGCALAVRIGDARLAIAQQQPAAPARAAAAAGGGVALPHAVRADQRGVQAAGRVTAADAAPFVGEWTLALQGPDQAGTFALSVNVDGEKVSGEISSEAVPRQAIREFSLVNKSLIMSYTFPWDGNPVDAVVSLTPGSDGKMTAQINFAGGAYVMSGTATKKEKSK